MYIRLTSYNLIITSCWPCMSLFCSWTWAHDESFLRWVMYKNAMAIITSPFLTPPTYLMHHALWVSRTGSDTFDAFLEKFALFVAFKHLLPHHGVALGLEKHPSSNQSAWIIMGYLEIGKSKLNQNTCRVCGSIYNPLSIFMHVTLHFRRAPHYIFFKKVVKST